MLIYLRDCGAWSLEPGAWSKTCGRGFDFLSDHQSDLSLEKEPGAWSLEPGAWSLEKEKEKEKMPAMREIVSDITPG